MIRHYQFACRHCGEPIMLLAEKLLQPFEDQGMSPNDSHSIAAICLQCKHAGMYSPDRNSPFYLPAFRVVSPARIVETECLGWLECDGKSCKFHAPLFSVMTLALFGEDRINEIHSWKWEELRCPAGHSMGNTIRKP
jgi:hypothetical protein